jgi:hypothetical protein
MTTAADYLNRTVRARNGAVVYDAEGYRIPEDGFVTVPLSAGLVTAIKAGDLEALPAGQAAPAAASHRTPPPSRRHSRGAAVADRPPQG